MITYDDTRLQEMLNRLEPKRRAQALRGGVRKTATRVRRVAVRNLRRSWTRRGSGSGLRAGKEMERGIRRVVYRRKALGFRVTIGSKGRAPRSAEAVVANSQGKRKPLLMWGEGGTASRHTRTRRDRRGLMRRGRPTGEMPAYGFMSRTREEVRDSVGDEMKDNIRKEITRIARKYGCV